MESLFTAKFFAIFLLSLPTEMEAAATSDCKTVGGPSSDVECIFPFKYFGITHNGCTVHGNTESEEKPWCSTKVDKNGLHVKDSYGYCGQECPEEDCGEGRPIPERCYTEGGDPCMFPFHYNGKEYYSCTWAGALKPWCGTTSWVRENLSERGWCQDGCPKEEPPWLTPSLILASITATHLALSLHDLIKRRFFESQPLMSLEMSSTRDVKLTDDAPNGTRLKNKLIRLRLSNRPGASESQEIFKKLLGDHNGEEHKVNLDIFRHSVRTCSEADYLLSHWDRDWGSGLDTFIKSKLTFNFSIVHHHLLFQLWMGYLIMVAKSTLYILDFAKDVSFIVLYNEKRAETVPLFSEMLVVFLAMAIGFLIASEAFKSILLWDTKRTPKAPWVLRMVLSPLQLLPIWNYHWERKLESRQRKLCGITEPNNDQEQSLTVTTNGLDRIRSMKGELRSTENVLEHFFQFILSVAVVVGSASGKEIIDLSQSEMRFSIFSSVVSLLSMVRGQVALISTQKNGQLGILAKCVLFPYMAIAILIRAGIIFLSIIATFNFILATYIHWDDIKTDITTTFRETSHLLFILVLIAVLILHIISSFLIQKRLLKGTKSNLKQSLWSFLSPPLFLDWDFLHIQENYEMPIPECWRRTRNSFLCHNILTLLGNLSLGIPFFLFRTEPQIEGLAYCLNWCEWHLDWALIAVLSTVILSQLVLIGLGFLYWRKFHPWSRILNEELAREGSSDSWLPQFCHARWFRRVDFLGVRTS